jgi:1-aminocyclopropane-1-carboxylate synthase
VRGGNAGFFVYLDLSPYLPKELDGEANADFALARKLVNAGVFLHPREEHAPRPGWFRMVYTHDEEVIKEGLKRWAIRSPVTIVIIVINTIVDATGS